MFCYGQVTSFPLEGEFHNYATFSVGSCSVSNMTVKYKLNTVANEPSVLLNFKWEAYETADDNCLSREQFEMFIEVGIDGKSVYIPATGILGTTPRGNNDWGYNPFVVPPDWDKLFLISLRGVKVGNSAGRVYVSNDMARTYWSSGNMKVNSVILLDKLGNKKAIQ
ncbi:hypothetical protein C3K47_09480 [Solitalea longa]|uniref:Uncharacterized protein n=2 Tax=Solitalea longa TaxID=2079460 RepID=A0A2S5A1Z7_9SPHI|nr:hypothetical protein C3K47_09480 [Solitalea longa]